MNEKKHDVAPHKSVSPSHKNEPQIVSKPRGSKMDELGLVKRLDRLEVRLEHLYGQLEDAKKVEELERNMKMMALVKKMDDVEIRATENGAGLLDQVNRRMDAAESDMDVMKRDVKLSLERFRESVNLVLKQLRDHVEAKLTNILQGLSTQHDNYLACNSRLLVLEEESSFNTQTTTSNSRQLTLLRNQVDHNKSLILQLQADVRTVSMQVKTMASLVERAIKKT